MNLTIITEDKTIKTEYSYPAHLSELLAITGNSLALPCNGNGKCGKCKAIAYGNLSPLNEIEKAHLTEEERKGDVRLLCQAIALGDVTVHYIKAPTKMQGVIDGYMTKMEDVVSDYSDGYGLAFDIGTTTVAGYLYKFPSKTPIATLCEENTERVHGADVISRIEFALSGGREQLHQEITSQIKEMSEKLLQDKTVTSTVITGNTAMLSFYCNVDTEGLSHAPFIPESLFGLWEDKVYFPPCMDAFVGADITTSILACGLTEHQTALLLDIGTNGEMALWHNDTLTCCSTAAGPAFEGVGISSGIEARSGAISKVSYENKKVAYETIDHAPPIGLCGTGVLDTVATFLKMGIIDETGYMEEDVSIGDSGIIFTCEDVRQVQLSKSAIRSGIEVLLYEAGITADDLEKVYIAGGFGSYISPHSAEVIGMIPSGMKDKVCAIGNGAGTGASMLLFRRSLAFEAESIAQSAKVINLANHPKFSEYFMEEMMFPC